MHDEYKKIKYLEKRFGIVAIEKGFITESELIDALKIQVCENIEKSTHRLIGQILFDNNIITSQQLDEVLTALFTSKRVADST